MQAEAVEVVAIAAVALAFALALPDATTPRRVRFVQGGVGLAGSAAMVAVPSFDLTLLALLALGVLQSVIAGARPFAVRMRPIAVAVGLMSVGLLFGRVAGPDVLARFGAVGLGAGLAAAIGLLPYVHVYDPGEGLPTSPVPWLAFIGPVLAAVFVARTQQVLGPDGWVALGGILIGLGLLNVVWGCVGAWFQSDAAVAWRYSFLADWGLALCGFGLTVLDGRRAALLVLFGIALCRLPLFLVWRQAAAEKTVTERPVNLVVAAALAGSAPFAGFAARILLLRAATQIFWPLALVLALAMLLWLPGSLRLGRSVGLPRGRLALAVVLVLVVNAAVGLYPLPLLSAANL